MRAIAEWLVARKPAATQHLTLAALVRATVGADDLDCSPDSVRTVDGRRNRWGFVLLDRLGAIVGEGKSSGWTAADNLHDLVCRCVAGVDERLCVGAKDGRETARALPIVATDSAVVVDGDVVGSGVAVATLGDRAVVGALCPVEALQTVCDVAERLVAGAAAATQVPDAALPHEFPFGVVDRHLTGHLVGPMLSYFNASRRAHSCNLLRHGRTEVTRTIARSHRHH